MRRSIVIALAAAALTAAPLSAAPAHADPAVSDAAPADSGPATAVAQPGEPSEGDVTQPAPVVSAAQFRALLAVAAADPCGSRCDGQDPETYTGYRPPGGPSNWRNCAGDARTVHSARPTSVWIELRYSPRCRTASVRNAHNDAGYKARGWLQTQGTNTYTDKY